MYAEEVKKISDSKIESIESYFNLIKEQASTGKRQIWVDNYNDHLIAGFVKLGYDTKIHTNIHSSEKFLIVSW